MSLKTHIEIMKFLWITISAAIFCMGIHAKVPENLKTNSETFCPEEWNSFGEFCYKGFPERLNFENAEKECVKLGGHLAAITSAEAQEFLTAKVLVPQGQKSYIGYQYNESTDESIWTDGSELTFTAWNPNEPTKKVPHGTFVENCAEMTFDNILKRMGKWNDISCTQRLPYICQKRKDPETVKPERKPGHCSWTLDDIYLRNTCYHLSLHLKTWEEAEKYCVEHFDGHLASVTDAAVQTFLHYELKNHPAKRSKFWIGLKLKPHEIPLWSSGWYVGFSHWKSKGQKNKVSFSTCAAMSRGGSGEWTLDSCDEHLSFICENSTVVPPPMLKPSDPGLKCPSEEWEDLGGDYCYIFNTGDWKSWYLANFFCMRKGGALASIHSNEESQAIAQFLRHVSDGVHIGFFRHDRGEDADGEFEWVDGSPVNYVNWGYGEPNSRAEVCAEANPNSMKWNDFQCYSERMFVCSVPKNGLLNRSKQTPCDQDQNKCTECLPTPAIVGVVLCVLLVIILLGVIIYNIIPWRKDSQQQNANKRKMSGTSGKHLQRRRELIVSDQIYENVERIT